MAGINPSNVVVEDVDDTRLVLLKIAITMHNLL